MGKKKKKKKEWKKHFSGRDGDNIHTSRTPKCWRDAACDYQNPGRKGPVARYRKPQDHHIVPVSAMIRYQDPKEPYTAYIDTMDAAYRDQDYCANNVENLWWLPTKPTYLGQSMRSLAWDLNLPCHTIGHSAYFKEVLVELRSRVWDPLAECQDEKKCPDPPELVTIAFKAVEKEFWRRLKYRGLRPGLTGGTRYAVNNEGVGDNWWHAFSMADAPDATEAVTTFITKEIPAALRRR